MKYFAGSLDNTGLACVNRNEQKLKPSRYRRQREGQMHDRMSSSKR
jgi:hypothetical protein